MKTGTELALPPAIRKHQPKPTKAELIEALAQRQHAKMLEAQEQSVKKRDESRAKLDDCIVAHACDNIAALAAHIRAIRSVENYGVGTLEQAFRGYQSLEDFTQGVPCWPETSATEYAGEWLRERFEMNTALPWETLMGSSVHAKPVRDRLAQNGASLNG